MVSIYNKFKFLINLSFIIFLILFSIFIFNYLVNPYKYFSKSGIISNGNYLTDSFFSRTPISTIMYKIREDIKNTHLSKVIIGSSRVLYGINTCEGKYLKVAIPGITTNQIIALLNESLKKDETNKVFVEVGISNEKNQKAIFNKPTFWDANFSFNVLYISVKSSIDYIFSNKYFAYPNCDYIVDSNIFRNTKDFHYFDYYKKNLSNELGEDILLYIKTVMSKIEKSNKEIIFFISPINIKINTHQFYQLETELFKKELEIIKNKYGSFKFINSFNLTIPKNEEELWYDLNHFKPLLGDILLNEFNKY